MQLNIFITLHDGLTAVMPPDNTSQVIAVSYKLLLQAIANMFSFFISTPFHFRETLKGSFGDIAAFSLFYGARSHSSTYVQAYVDDDLLTFESYIEQSGAFFVIKESSENFPL